MGNPAENGRIQLVEIRLSREEFSPQQLKGVIQRSIDENENGDPIEIEIDGEKPLSLSHIVFRLLNALPPRYKETQNRFFELVVDPALEKATHIIIRKI